MNLLSNLPTKYDYTRRIQSSSYEQTVDKLVPEKQSTNVSFHDICSLFISSFDPTCQLLESKEKPMYINQRLIELATEIDESVETAYTCFKYSKLMKPTFIQQSLQLKNQLSSLLYLSDLYKVTTHVYLKQQQKYIVTSQKNNRDTFSILYHQSRFSELQNPPDNYTEGTYEDLGQCFELDVKQLGVYVTHLLPISKYKMSELQEIAKQINIPIDSLGKRKVKKQVYDEINVYYLNH